ncbi:flagellar hook-basal body complex protein [Plesiomonas shigelloides subsp. oncorhynchi]|nr:flagellar hook-basal body complex protein [Plesiomonas shigelloides]
MSSISLSGLFAAQKDLSTTSNNIANANTVGFKESRAEFSDVYSSSIFSNPKTTVGGGVQTSMISQQFHEGSTRYTNNPLDLRVNGKGFLPSVTVWITKMSA